MAEVISFSARGKTPPPAPPAAVKAPAAAGMFSPSTVSYLKLFRHEPAKRQALLALAVAKHGLSLDDAVMIQEMCIIIDKFIEMTGHMFMRDNGVLLDKLWRDYLGQFIGGDGDGPQAA